MTAKAVAACRRSSAEMGTAPGSRTTMKGVLRSGLDML
jgi:hypothetical protein